MSLKIEVARRQLGMAMHLYLQDVDPVSVHCLANAGCELMEFFAKKLAGTTLPRTAVLTRGSDFVGLRHLQRQYWIAFKHATEQGKPDKERDDNKLLMRFTDKQNDLALVVGWADYFRATGKIPMEAQVQQAWYFALHPEMGGGQESVFFPNLRVQHRAEQKRRLNQVIETARMDEVKMSHSATERRPLVLDWSPH